MSLPESMSRIVIVGTKSRMEEAIEAFYNVRMLHLIDHTTGTDGLSIGTTLPTNSKASERLLKIRAMEKELGIVKKTKTDAISVEDLQNRITSGSVEGIEDETRKALDVRNDLIQRIADLNAKKKSLELLAELPIDLEFYSGYKSLAVIVGTVKDDPSEALKKLTDSEVFVSYNKKKGGVVAVFARADERDKASSVLSEYGFAEMTVPEGTGSPAETIAETDKSIADFSAQLESAEEDIDALRTKHMAFLSASDEELSIEIEKGELPLKIAVGEYSYIMDAWVPTKNVQTVKTELESSLGSGVHVELEETRGRNLHEEEEIEDRFKTVPTKGNNGLVAKEFEYATSLVSTPKYHEIDPSILIMFFLPLFFGFMIGDCGYAIPFIIIGAYGLKVTHHKDWRSIAVVLFLGGIWAFIFGFFFFGEALGMHFIGPWEPPLSMTWEAILGVQLPEWFSGLMVDGHGISKLGDHVGMLLKLSVYIGIIHLLIGHVCGYINIRMQHNNKAAFLEKGGAIMSFIGMVILCYSLTQWMFDGIPFEGNLLYILIVGAVLMAIGTAISFKTEKIMAILDLPGIIGNILSYTRLVAIGMSKAGMAVAFNFIVFGMIMGMTETVDFGSVSIIMLILGLILFGFLHLVTWTLGILSSGLHALRLQFVELMTKFYSGGGVKYEPLKIMRKKTFLFKTESEKEV